MGRKSNCFLIILLLLDDLFSGYREPPLFKFIDGS